MADLGDDVSTSGIMDCLYTLYAGSNEGGIIIDPTVSDSPALVVATFGKPPASPAVVLEHTYDEAFFVSDLMKTYPFSKFMLVTYTDEATPASGPTYVGAPSEGWLEQLPPQFCCLNLFRFQRHVMFAPLVCEVNDHWIRELRELSYNLHNPQQLVVHLFLRTGFRIKLEALCHLVAECHWIGNENLVALLLQRMAAWTDKESQTSFTDPSSAVSGTLQVRCKAHLERVCHFFPKCGMLELGFRINGVTLPRDDYGTDVRRDLLPKQQLQKKSPLWLLVLHACGSGRTRRSMDEVQWLLEQLTLDDVVFVSLAGVVVVQPSHAKEAICQWEANKESTREHNKKHRLPLRVAMLEMWAQARAVLRHWRHERHCRLVRGGPAVDIRIAILFFAPSSCGSVDELSISSIRHRSAFYRVPVFSVVTPERVKNSCALLDLCLLTQGRILCSAGDVADFQSNMPTEEACKNLIRTTLQTIRDISHMNSALFLVANHSSGRPAELLRTSKIFGETITALLRSDTPIKTRSGRYLLLGPIQKETELPVYISHHLYEDLDAANTGLRMMVFAYAIDKGEYEVVPIRSLGSLKETAPPERVWWARLCFAMALLDDMQARRMASGIRPRHLFECDAESRYVTYSIGDIHLARKGERCGLLLASWILSQCTTRSAGGLEDAMPSSIASPSPDLSHALLRREDEGWWAMPPAVPFFLHRIPRPFVNLLWTNFPVHGAYASSVAAILSRTFPFKPIELEASFLSSSATLALESLRCNNAVVRLASVKHVPVLVEAQARYIVLFSVNLSTERMKMRQLIPAHLSGGLVKSIAHEFRDLGFSEVYCVVHLALRRAPSFWVSQDDVVVADGIAFSTPFATVRSVKIISVTHNSVEVEWSGSASSVKLICWPLPWNGLRNVNTLPLVSSNVHEPVILEHDFSSRCVITELRPCTVYVLEVRPVERGDDRSIAKGFLWSEGFEMYFATCVEHTKGSLKLDSVTPSATGFSPVFSYPIFTRVAVLSSSKMLELRITPTISTTASHHGEQSVRTQKKDDGVECVLASFSIHGSGPIFVDVLFDVEVRPIRPQEGADRKRGWSAYSVSPQREEVGPFEVVSELWCASRSPRVAKMEWQGASISFNVDVKSCSSLGEDVCVFKRVVSGLGPLCLTLDNLEPCTKYMATVKTASGRETVSTEFFTPPEPPLRDAVIATSNMASLLLRVQIPESDVDQKFTSVTILPLKLFLSNSDGASTSTVASYSNVPVGQPIVLGLEANWRPGSTDSIRSVPNYLFAVTDVSCSTNPDESVMLAWTCAAMHHHSPLKVKLNGELCVPGARNEIRVVMLPLTPVRISFHGPAIIPEVSSIFLLPRPPSLNPSNCSVSAVIGGAVGVHISRTLCASLLRLLRDVKEVVRVFLCFSISETMEEEEIELHVDESDMNGVVARALVSNCPRKRRMTLCVRLQENDNYYYDNFLLSHKTEEAALLSRPISLIPQALSEPFTVSIAPPACIQGLHVTALRPRSVTLAWTLPGKRDLDTAEHDDIYFTVRCAAEEHHGRAFRQNLRLPAHSVNFGGLSPATPYIVTVSEYEDDVDKVIRLVTPHELTNDTLSEMLLSVNASLAWGDREGTMAVESGSGHAVTEAMALRLTLPPAKCVFWTIFSHLAWFGEETVDCDPASPCFCVCAFMQVAAVADSGRSLHLWSHTDESQAQTASHVFPIGQGEMAAPLPHLDVKWRTNVRHVPRLQEDFSSSPAETATNTIMSTTINTNSMNTPSEQRIIVDVVGCPKLQSMDKEHCTVEWNGSCASYTVHWRVDPTGAIHTETVVREPGRRPQLTVDIRSLRFTVVLFCVQGAVDASNCALFTVLVPFILTGPRLCSHDEEEKEEEEENARKQTHRDLSSDLVKVKWHRDVGPNMPHEKKESVCSLSVIDRSNNVWVKGFTEMLGDRFSGKSPDPFSITWLNPVVHLRSH
ncbi:hypothetical protein BCY84_02313 [Trypanosoma cruzi cruzi]|nr:hypothetical protein BCY84_02313 [Trypanosoma cruzi cruzi]